MGRKSKYLSGDEESLEQENKVWNVGIYIRLSQEDGEIR